MQVRAKKSLGQHFLTDLSIARRIAESLQPDGAAEDNPADVLEIGPGMGVYSRYAKVMEADGSAMRVRTALLVINAELDAYFSEQDGALDAESRFCVDLYTQFAFNHMKFG